MKVIGIYQKLLKLIIKAANGTATLLIYSRLLKGVSSFK